MKQKRIEIKNMLNNNKEITNKNKKMNFKLTVCLTE